MAPWLQKCARLWCHRWSEGQVARAFPPEVLRSIESAVATSECQHTGQIRVCIEGGLPWSYLWREAPARERALRLFGKLGVWDTEANNGVLIYLLMADHAIEIVADRAIARAVPAATWDGLVQSMHTAFGKHDFAQGLAQAIQATSALLITHFPSQGEHTEPSTADLPNAPVVQGRYFKDR